MKEVDRAYLAGLFDGEGCASVTHGPYRKETTKGGKLYWGHKVHFVISSQDKHALKKVRRLFEKGGIYDQDRSKSINSLSQRTTYDFRITKPTDVIKVIDLISPYVIIKEDDLENLRDAAKFILRVRGSKERHKWTEEEGKEFEKFAKNSRDLKGGGKRGRRRKLRRERMV